MVGNGHRGLAREDEVHLEAGLLHEFLEVGKEGQAALHAVDTAHVEDEGSLEAVTRREVEGGIGLGQVEPAADHGARNVFVAAHPRHQLLLLGSQIDDSPGAPEEGLEDPEVDGGVVFGRGHEEGLLAHPRQPRPGVVVAIAVEEEEVEPVLRALHRPHEVGREGPILAHPGFFFRPAVVVVEDDVAQGGKHPGVASALHGEAVDGQTVDLAPAFRIVVAPLEVIEGAGGEDLDVVAPRQALGQEPAVHLGSPVHLETVALDDEGEPHAAAAPPAATRPRSRSHLSRTTGQAWCAAT